VRSELTWSDWLNGSKGASDIGCSFASVVLYQVSCSGDQITT